MTRLRTRLRRGKNRAIQKLIKSEINPIPQKMQPTRLPPQKKQTKGAFGKHAKTVSRKLAFIAESCAQANELTRERQVRQAYTKFFKTDDGKAFAKEFGKSIPSNGPAAAGRRGCN